MQSETLEPIVFYMQEYQNEASSTFSQAEKLYKNYEELQAVVDEQKTQYFAAKETAERSDLKMEQTMIANNRGECDDEAVIAVSKDSMLLKYTAELA